LMTLRSHSGATKVRRSHEREQNKILEIIPRDVLR
jgi:hypothetical protein